MDKASDHCTPDALSLPPRNETRHPPIPSLPPAPQTSRKLDNQFPVPHLFQNFPPSERYGQEFNPIRCEPLTSLPSREMFIGQPRRSFDAGLPYGGWKERGVSGALTSRPAPRIDEFDLRGNGSIDFGLPSYLQPYGADNWQHPDPSVNSKHPMPFPPHQRAFTEFHPPQYPNALPFQMPPNTEDMGRDRFPWSPVQEQQSPLSVFIGNIPKNTNPDTLHRLLALKGTATEVVCDFRGDCWLTAFVTYSKPSEAAKAVEFFNNRRAIKTAPPHRLVCCFAPHPPASLSCSCVHTGDLPPGDSPVLPPFFPKFGMERGEGSGGRTPAVPRFSLLKDGPPGANLFIYGIPSDWTEVTLMRLCQDFGHIVGIRVPGAPTSGPQRLNKGFGFVSYDSTLSSTRALEALSGRQFLGKPLNIQLKLGEQLPGYATSTESTPMNRPPLTSFRSQSDAAMVHPPPSSNRYSPCFHPESNPGINPLNRSFSHAFPQPEANIWSHLLTPSTQNDKALPTTPTPLSPRDWGQIDSPVKEPAEDDISRLKAANDVRNPTLSECGSTSFNMSTSTAASTSEVHGKGNFDSSSFLHSVLNYIALQTEARPSIGGGESICQPLDSLTSNQMLDPLELETGVLKLLEEQWHRDSDLLFQPPPSTELKDASFEDIRALFNHWRRTSLTKGTDGEDTNWDFAVPGASDEQSLVPLFGPQRG